MPSSSPGNLEPVILLLQDLRPRRVLEIGIGHGKYGVLLREYLEVALDRYSRPQWHLELVGVEAFPAYRNPLWDYAYNRVIVEDIRQVDLASLGRFDCCLLLDVIEHFEPAEGRAQLERLLDVCDQLIVSTPIKFVAQDALYGNEYERHRSLWRRKDFRPYHCLYHKARDCSVAVLSRRGLPSLLGEQLLLRHRLRLRALRILPGPVVRLIVWLKAAARAGWRLLHTYEGTER